MTRREHIEQIAADIGATIIYDAARYRQTANTVNRELHLAPWPGEEPVFSVWALLSGSLYGDHDVPEEELYWVALHEAGHLETTPVPDARVESVLEYEARAWAWALEHARFPLDQAGQSSIAWGIADYAHHRGLDPETSEAMRKLLEALGPEPDWYMNVTEPEHWAKLDGWAKPTWAALIAQAGLTVAA